MKPMLKKKNWLLALIIILLPLHVFAADLMQSYHDALRNDPTFKQAQANMLADQEALPQAFSQLLPQLNGQASYSYIRQTSAGGGAGGSVEPNSGVASPLFIAFQKNYVLNLSQVLFDYTTFENVAVTRYQALAAEASYEASAQNLIQRVSVTYFDVLLAQDILKFDKANTKALGRQLEQVSEQFKVGLKTIKDVYEIQASYDASIAQYIEDEKNLADARENLRAITGEKYRVFSVVKKAVPFLAPHPKDVEAWVHAAEKHNFTLFADRLNVKAAKHNIQVQFGGHLPTLSVVGQFNKVFTFPRGLPGRLVRQTQQIGVQLNVPIFQGGLVTSEVRQAEDEYLAQVAQLELDFRNIISQTRQDYLGVIASIAKIQADKKAIESSQKSLESSKAEFQVGTATVLDVLTQQSNLLEAYTNYARDLYSYLNDTINLKADTGLLMVNDVKRINSWLRPGKYIKLHFNADIFPQGFVK